MTVHRGDRCVKVRGARHLNERHANGTPPTPHPTHTRAPHAAAPHSTDHLTNLTGRGTILV